VIKQKVLITGGNGFVARNLIKVLHSQHDLSATFRKCLINSDNIKGHRIDIDGDSDWSDILVGVECIIHTAALVHIKAGDHQSSEKRIYEVNTIGTLNLAKQAAANGVKRFIFISTIGVLGDVNEKPFTECDRPKPCGAYAKSKCSAEKGLWEISKSTTMDVVIIRPPMVYGKDAPGNFSNIIKLLNAVRILPFASIKNSRTFLHIDNLVALISICIVHQNAANQLFLVGDAEDISTPSFIKLTSDSMGKRCMMVWFPEGLLRVTLTLLGQKKIAHRLCNSLRVDTTKAQISLGWKPVVSLQEGLKRST
jgi:nucleoside-diphosphate-sugar epimerase